MPATLCAICTGIFTGGHALKQGQPHHRNLDGFIDAARNGCHLCRIITASSIWNSVRAQQPHQPATWYLFPLRRSPPGWLRLSIDCLADEDQGESKSGSDSGSDSGSGSVLDSSVNQYPPPSPAWGFILQPVDGIDISTNVASVSRALPTGLEDPSMFDIAKTWLKECLQTHPFCRAPLPSFTPTRLVHIVNKNLVRVVLSQEQNAHHSYAAFSHCWGKAKTVKLLKADMQALQHGIPILDLPLSYQEALSVCQALDVSYIWIDSLCIIQDSIDDWTREAAMMKDVYQNSILNICATAAAESSEASFQCRDTSLIVPFEVDVVLKEAETRRYQVVASYDIEDDILTSPLRSRAWVYQEDVLSKRSLSLTRGQLWWECQQTIACETYPSGMPTHLFPENQAARYLARQELSRHSQASGSSFSDDENDRKYWHWYTSIEDYSEGALTQPTDKLVALSGVAQSYRDLNRLQDEDYIAGFWKSQLPYALCWHPTTYKWTYRPPVYVAPSWSWASINGGVKYPFLAEEMKQDSTKSLCQITRIKLHYVHAHYKTGPLRGGCIHLRGNIGPITREFEYLTEDDEI